MRQRCERSDGADDREESSASVLRSNQSILNLTLIHCDFKKGAALGDVNERQTILVLIPSLVLDWVLFFAAHSTFSQESQPLSNLSNLSAFRPLHLPYCTDFYKFSSVPLSGFQSRRLCEIWRSFELSFKRFLTACLTNPANSLSVWVFIST